MKQLLYLTLILAVLILASCRSDNSTLQLTPEVSDSPSPLPTQSSPSQFVPLIEFEEMPEVTMKTDQGSYPSDLEMIKVYLDNKSDHDVVYGEYFELYIDVNGKWTFVEDISMMPYPSIPYGLSASTSVDKTYRINERFGTLQIGEYRIYVDYQVSIRGDWKTFVAVAGFSIIDNA